MKAKIRIISLSAAIILLLACLFGCTAGSGAETTGKTDKDQESKEPDTTVVEVPEKLTHTVPLRYEKDGKVLREFSYSEDGLSLSMTDYTEETPITYTVTFNEKGQPQKMEWTVTVNDTRSELWRDDYYLDENGRIVDEKRYCEGQIQNAYTYTYDSEGRMETQQSRNVKQENILYRLLYDDMGTHVGTRYKKYNGEAGDYSEPKTCTYDSEGRIVLEEYSSYSVAYDYTVKGGHVTQKKVTNTAGDYSWSYYFQYTYEDGCLVREDSYFDKELTDSTYYCETKFEHYKTAVDWIFRERLP